MSDTHKQFREVFEELYTLAIPDKILFLEALLHYFTLTSRGIWTDGNPSDLEKVEAFKWLNELAHRIWNIRFDLLQGEDNDSITRLYENMKFYAEHSSLVKMHLVPTTLGAYRNYLAFRKK